MSLLMAEPVPVRLVLQSAEEVRSALRLAAAKRGAEMSEVADEILRAGLADEIEEIRTLRQPHDDRRKKS